MPLRRIAVQNYRCFRDRQELEVAPVTVVLGKNNSGKSALVRAPLVFATGFGPGANAPLDLERLGAETVDAFTDLVFERSPHGNIGVELDVDGVRSFGLSATLQYVDEIQDAFVSAVTLTVPGGPVQLAWAPQLSSTDPPHPYTIRFPDGRERQVTVPFRGLAPAEPPIPELRGWTGEALSLGPIRYLGPYRDRVQRQHRLPLGVPRELGDRGQRTSVFLAHDRARGSGDLIGTVNSYLSAIVPEWELDEVPVGPLWSTVLRRRSGDGFQVNFADASVGLAQVLPILVQCALDEQAGPRTDAPLQIIEEPEMHLHPAVHADLADLYLRTAQRTQTRFLVETHSETLLLRLRRRIAEGACAPGMVAVYVVEQADGVSTVRRVHIDDLGNLSEDWPEGYFSIDYHEVRALAAAQLRRSEHAS